MSIKSPVLSPQALFITFDGHLQSLEKQWRALNNKNDNEWFFETNKNQDCAIYSSLVLFLAFDVCKPQYTYL